MQFPDVTVTLRVGLALLLCGGLNGCAMLPMAAVNLAAQGAQGLVALSLGPLSDMQERSTKDRCELATAKGFSVNETMETTSPTGEGKVSVFELVLWRPEFAREGYPQVERSRSSTERSLTITDRSVSFIPPPGAISVRVPYELVQEVDLSSAAGARSMIVKSCFGRFDIVTFRQAQDLDPGAATEAAAELQARLAAFRKSANN
jgi:hypothetical protein